MLVGQTIEKGASTSQRSFLAQEARADLWDGEVKGLQRQFLVTACNLTPRASSSGLRRKWTLFLKREGQEGVPQANEQQTPNKETMVQNVILVFFRRRLSQRPAVEELERRNILKRKYRLECFCPPCRLSLLIASSSDSLYFLYESVWMTKLLILCGVWISRSLLYS